MRVISGEDVAVPVQFAHVTGWLAFRSWLSRNSWRWCVGCGCTLIALSLTACHSDPPASAQQNRPEASVPKETSPPKQVKVVRVIDTPLERTTVALGSLAAFDQATISVKVPGRLRSITVDLGSLVQRGQLIAQIEPQDYQLRVQQAEAAVSQARVRLGLPPTGTNDNIDQEQTSLVRQARVLAEEAGANRDRLASLLEQGITPRAQVDTAEASYKVALSRLEDAREEIHNRRAVLAQRRSELEIARQQLADVSVYAPFDGAIQEKRASVGEYLAAGAPVATIVRMDPLRLRAEVPEREVPNVRVGQTVRVTTEGDPNVYTGRIARLSPTITPQNRMLMVEAEVKNTDGALRPGSFARAEIVTDDRGMSLTVPTRSIINFAGVEKIIVVKDGKAVEKPITTRRRTTEWTEVVSGVTVGEAVVLEPGNLQSGQAVTVVE
jgi:membrane fusion protein, multidrug efflux system